jgi:hypothetical protein
MHKKKRIISGLLCPSHPYKTLTLGAGKNLLIVIEMENFSYEEPNGVCMVREEQSGFSKRATAKPALTVTLCAKYRHIGLKCVQGCTPLFKPFFPCARLHGRLTPILIHYV